MLDAVTLYGLEAAIVWGYRTAASIKSWTVTHAAAAEGGIWTLEATVTRADPFKLKQADLKFTAPRKGGYFCWPIQTVTVSGSTLGAVLGPPER